MNRPVVISIATFALVRFVCWYGGVDLFERSFLAAWAFSISLLAALASYWVESEKRAISNPTEKEQ